MRGAEIVLFGILVTQTIPGIVVANALFRAYSDLGVLNSTTGLILADASQGVPFAILVMRAYFARLPGEVLEAARLDGAGPIRTFVSIVLPMSRNALITAGLFTFLFTWSDFLFALTLTTTSDVRPRDSGHLSVPGRVREQLELRYGHRRAGAPYRLWCCWWWPSASSPPVCRTERSGEREPTCARRRTAPSSVPRASPLQASVDLRLWDCGSAWKIMAADPELRPGFNKLVFSARHAGPRSAGRFRRGRKRWWFERLLCCAPRDQLTGLVGTNFSACCPDLPGQHPVKESPV